MKYFSPTYLFKLWLVITPIFSYQTKGINNNKSKIKDWVSKNTSLNSVSYKLNFTSNNQTYFINNYQTNLDIQQNNNLNIISPYKNHHEKSRHRYKRDQNEKKYLIFNTYHNEYLYAADNAAAYNSERRRVFTWRYKNQKVTQGYWKLEKSNEDDCIYSIKNTYHNEYLYAADNAAAYNSERRRVFTWRYKNQKVTQGYWKLEKSNEDDCIYSIKNTYHNEYLYAADNAAAYNSERRRVFTWRYKNQKVTQGYWKLENSEGFNNLKHDFPDYNKQEINLGLINDNNDFDIKNAIKNKYNNIDINGITIIEKKYSSFDNHDKFGGFLAKVSIIKTNNICFYDKYGNLTSRFSYVTQTKLDEISNIIANDPKVKQWISHINEWNSTLPQAIENVKTFSPEALYNWKRNEKEIIKSYIRDWSQISTLIEHKLKLDELNKNVQGLKASFDSIKSQINELEQKVNNLDKRVTNLENQSNANCANIAGLIGSIISIVPVIGNVAGAIGGITSGTCAIAGV